MLSRLDRESQRRWFKRELVQMVDYLVAKYKLDRDREYHLARWFDQRLQTPQGPVYRLVGRGDLRLVNAGRVAQPLAVMELLGNAGSVTNLKRDFVVKKAVQAGKDYNWVRVVIDQAARKVQSIRVPETLRGPGGGTAGPGLQGQVLYGSRNKKAEDPTEIKYSHLASKARPPRKREAPPGEGRQSFYRVRAGGGELKVPRGVYEDKKRFVDWLVLKFRTDAGARRLIGSVVKEGRKFWGTPLGEAAQAAYYRAHVQSLMGGGHALNAKLPWYNYVKIPFGQYKGQPLGELDWVLDKRSGKRKDASTYVMTLENLRDKEVPGRRQTYAQQYPQFYAALEVMLRQPSWAPVVRRAEAIGDESAPRDLQPFYDLHRRQTARIVRDYYGGVLPSRRRILKDYKRGRLTYKQLATLWTREDEFADAVRWSDYSEKRQRGFAPSDKQTNPWWFKSDLKTGLSLNIAGVNNYGDEYEAWKRGEASLTPWGRKQARSHFFQQQTYPHSMLRGAIRYPKEWDPEYYESLDEGKARGVVFQRVYKRRPDPRKGDKVPFAERGSYLPGVRIESVRDSTLEEFLGGSEMFRRYQKLPKSEQAFLRRLAKENAEEWLRGQMVATRIEDFAGRVKAQPDPAVGEYRKEFSGVWELLEERGVDEDERWLEKLRRKVGDVTERDPTFTDRVRAARSRQELDEVARDYQEYWKGVPPEGLSPVHDEFERYWKGRYNALALKETKRLPS